MSKRATELSADEEALSSRLRRVTAPAHERLEAELGLAPDTASRQRIVEILQTFGEFYREWDAWLARSALPRGLVQPRLKGAIVRRDLDALGVETSVDPASRPMNLAAPSVGYALGSLYVVEGSTLGGQIISRWIKGAEWLPAGGLFYFNSYGPEVGSMWRSFRGELDRHDAEEHAVIAGANDTFAELERRFARQGDMP